MDRPRGVGGSSDDVVSKRVVLFVGSLAHFLGAFMASSVNIAIPSIGHEFGVDAVGLTWIATAYVLSLAMFMVPMGKLADIKGRKRIFLLGVLGWTVTSVLCAVAFSAPLLILFRWLQGIAGAMFFGTSMAIIASVYTGRERGRALGIAVASVYVGLAIGPSVGGILTQHVGWRSVFSLNAVLSLLILGLILWKIRAEWAEARGQKLDLVGSVVFALALLAVMYGFSLLPAATGGSLILAGLLGLVVFVWWELRVPDPVLNIDLFRHNVVFALSNVAALTNYSATAAISFLLSLYLQYVKGLDPQSAGLVLLSQPVVMATFSPLAGRLSDRVEPRIVASTGMAITMAGLVMLALVNDGSTLGYIVVALVVAGFGFALFSSPNSNAIMSSVDRAYLGIASAAVGMARTIGQMLSMGIATLIIAVYVGGVQITPESHAAFSNGFRLAFAISACLCLVGVFCSLARGKLHVEPAQTIATAEGERP